MSCLGIETVQKTAPANWSEEMSLNYKTSYETAAPNWYIFYCSSRWNLLCILLPSSLLPGYPPFSVALLLPSLHPCLPPSSLHSFFEFPPPLLPSPVCILLPLSIRLSHSFLPSSLSPSFLLSFSPHLSVFFLPSQPPPPPPTILSSHVHVCQQWIVRRWG